METRSWISSMRSGNETLPYLPKPKKRGQKPRFLFYLISLRPSYDSSIRTIYLELSILHGDRHGGVLSASVNLGVHDFRSCVESPDDLPGIVKQVDLFSLERHRIAFIHLLILLKGKSPRDRPPLPFLRKRASPTNSRPREH